MNASTLGRLLATLTIVFLVTCKDAVGPPPPPDTNPGTMLVELGTPNGNDGAVLLFLRGSGIEAVNPTSASYRVFFRNSGGVLRVAVVGDIQPGPILHLDVSNVNVAFSGTVVDAADRTNQQVAGESPPQGYFVTIRPVN